MQKYGIAINTNNMIGIPTETTMDSLETIKFNARNGVGIAVRDLFMPLRFTKLYDFCRENNLFKSVNKTETDSVYNETLLKFKNYSDMEIKFILASWNLLFIIYRKLYKFNKDLYIKLFDFLIILLKPVYPLLIFLRNRFFAGKLLTYLYKKTEENINWTEKS